MITLYVVPSDRAAGKTAIAAGLGKRWLGDGKKVGFFRPRIAGSMEETNDAAFMKQVLSLPEAVDSMCPLIEDAPPDKITAAFTGAAAGKDVVIVEGQLGASPEDNLSKASYQIARALNARVLVVEVYSSKSGPIDRYQGFGENLLGVIINKVPKSQLQRVQGEMRAQYSAAGVNVLGVLPEDRLLLAPTVGDLANCIQGRILSGAEKSAELVENLLVGALTVDSGLLYFGRKANKAAIIRVDRPDMQLAALETSTKCLVISGAGTVYHRVVDKAGSKGIPLVQAESDTNTIVTMIEAALAGARFTQEKKLPRLAEVLQQSVDFNILYRGLGLAS